MPGLRSYLRGRNAAVRRSAVGGLAALVVGGLTAAGAVPAGAASAPSGATGTAAKEAGSGGRRVAVIVQGSGGTAHAAAAVARLGGRVTRKLPLVDGVAATVPAAAVPALRAATGVRAVTPDRQMRVQATVPAGQGGATDDTTQAELTALGTSAYRAAVRANQAQAAGVTGAGITVALLDTGIAPDLPDLAGRVVPVQVRGELTKPCMNFSGEKTCADSYGHGTFMAGLIAGSGAASAGRNRGVAPGARLLSVKVGGRDGSADVSAVLAAIQWVVSFRDTYGVRVLNLSLGTNSTASYREDPLNYAVEKAWRAGIAVVVAGSNLGPARGTISKPADDPYVITVGATDDRGTAGLGDDRLPDFSGRGPTAADGLAKPDVTAPGARVMSLRAPGSYIDTTAPPPGTGAYRAGSGTSMSAAVVSGVSALVLSRNPAMAPDRLKHVLARTARLAASADPLEVGAGTVDAEAAALRPGWGRANSGLSASSGLGLLSASRGSMLVRTRDPNRLVLDGVLTAQLLAWDVAPFLNTWAPWSWSATSFATATWYGSNWHGSNWHGSNWHGASYFGDPMATPSYGDTVPGSAWYGAWAR